MSRNWKALILTLVIAAPTASQSKEDHIAEAVLPLPEALRSHAKVIRYEAGAERSILHEGTNDWICMTDDPSPGILLQCYHSSLDGFFHRNRELRAQGKSREERQSIREQEFKSGKLEMPDQAVVFALIGNSLDNALPITTVWIPFATAESTGLPTERDNHRPWLMNAGTIGAHIMFPGV